MAEQLKHILGKEAVRWLADSLAAAYPEFPRVAFVRSCLDGLDALELKPRAMHIADAMFRHLPDDYPAAASIIAASLGPECDPSGNTGVNVLRYLAHDCFILKYGIDHFEESSRLQYELTKRASCEFSIRAFIEKYPEQSLAQLRIWAGDKSAHVRRLVSEGTRPRLPWAPRLRAFQRDPAPVVALLELLRDDPARYVQRSVANNLNDIAKDHPDLAVSICARWLKGASADRKWIVGHALRLLVKQGHPGALAIMGAGRRPQVRISDFKLSAAKPVRGDRLRFSFRLESASDDDQELLVDYAVHYVKAGGRTNRKVFKLKRVVLAPRSSVALRRSFSLADMTTRKHYPGTHMIEALINGEAYPLGQFELQAV